jgi:hypothetical protein
MTPTPQDVLEYVAGRNDLVHASYLYGCEECKHMEVLYLGVGVEGPDREQAWIPSPFMGPPCRRCGGATRHIAWNLDQRFRDPIPPPKGARYFAVPPDGPNRRALGSSVFAGEIRESR